jgi:hypothetical protein
MTIQALDPKEPKAPALRKKRGTSAKKPPNTEEACFFLPSIHGGHAPSINAGTSQGGKTGLPDWARGRKTIFRGNRVLRRLVVRRVLVAHACNPSYSGGEIRRIVV